MSFNITLGNFLFKNAFPLYEPLYGVFKMRQDALEIALLKQHVKPGYKVLDIGANIGFYAKILSRLVGPTGKVYCLEPDEQNFKHLKKLHYKYPNIIAHNHAVAGHSGPITVYTSKNLNVDHRTYKPDDYDKEVTVHAVSIDDYLRFSDHLGLQKINFIKMDIQGFEMQALRGMDRTLSENHDLKIISEFWPYGLHKAGSSAAEYYNALLAKGFKCYLLKNESMGELTPQMVNEMEHLGEEHYFNILASRSDV